MSETSISCTDNKREKLLKDIKQIITYRMNDDDEKNRPTNLDATALSTEKEQVHSTEKESKIHDTSVQNEVTLGSLIRGLT